MKTMILPSMLAMIMAGCSSFRSPTRHDVHESEPQEFMFVSADGKKEWYSALEFDRIARRHAAEQKLPFDFEGTKPMVWVKTDGDRVLANVFYSSGLGQPALHVAINRKGRVIHHHIGEAVCELRDETQGGTQ
jgi:hypothetical protein